MDIEATPYKPGTAETSLRNKGKEYRVITDILFANNKAILKKVHQTNGWIILHRSSSGNCTVTVGNCSKQVDFLPEHELAIFIPAGIEYSIQTIVSDVTYTILCQADPEK